MDNFILKKVFALFSLVLMFGTVSRAEVRKVHCCTIKTALCSDRGRSSDLLIKAPVTITATGGEKSPVYEPVTGRNVIEHQYCPTAARFQF